MIRIRLRRTGKTHHATYRMVVAEKMTKRDGGFLETLGSYDPHANPPAIQIDTERAKEWLGKGAQPSEAAHKILAKAGVLEPLAAPVKKAAPVAAAAPASPAPVAAAPAEEPSAEAEAPVADEESSESES
ncbi:MAG TPA: 30S ribosomal protein S16 [Tepidiformaceae bacterium]|nr:30S ribosomal protein S16 [Tepidiformaceae bacterium]